MTPSDLWEPVFSGVTFGLLLAVMIGPVFFTLLQTSLNEGFRASVYLAAGVMMSDATVIAICYSFASILRLVDENQTAMGWAGGLLLISFGIFNFFHRVKIREVDDTRKAVHGKFVLKGFLMNILNPAVILFWLGGVGLVTVKENYTRLHEAVFFGSTLFTVFATDIFKGYIAHRIKRLLTENTMKWINRVTGIVLIGFGIHMILKRS